MSVLLTVVAHASTSATRDAAFPRDEPIDAAGEAKAAALAAGLRRVDAAWTSPALRARQTAAAMGLTPVVAPALADLDCGRWSGSRLAELETSEPDAVAAWLTDPAAAPHGGESLLDLLRRVDAWMGSVAEGAERVVAVTHPAVIRGAILLALRAEPASFWRIDVAPLGRARLRGGSGRWTLLGLG